MSYNGWKNWETWNVALWCDNEEGIYRDRMRQKPRTAEECEAFAREWFPSGTPDMADAYEAREAVDWDEIASHWRDDYSEDELERETQ
jgi:hypothetical protein